MELIVHAGYPKSATSTIQAKLYANREQLIQHGILYPSTGIYKKERAHHLLGWALAGQVSPTGSLPPKPEKIINELYREAKIAAAKRVIISSESLAVVLRDNPSQLISVLQEGPFHHVRLELVVRRADEYLESFFFHSLNSWARNRHPATIPDIRQARQLILANPAGHLRIAQNAVASNLPCRLRAYDRTGQVVEELLGDMLGNSAQPLLPLMNEKDKTVRNLRSNSRFLALVYLLSQSSAASRLQPQLPPHLRQLRLAFNDGQPCGILNDEQRHTIIQSAIPIYQALPGLQALRKTPPADEGGKLASFESQWAFSTAQSQLVHELFNLDLSRLARFTS